MNRAPFRIVGSPSPEFIIIAFYDKGVVLVIQRNKTFSYRLLQIKHIQSGIVLHWHVHSNVK